MDDDQDSGGGNEVAVPKWMPTFADMMTLLMCFFVLLLTFAEMNVKRYQQIAGSMASAFGVQRKVEATQIPMGTSIIAQEYSPGRPEPTPISEIYQQSDERPPIEPQVEQEREEIEPVEERAEESAAESAQDSDAQASSADVAELLREQIDSLIKETQADAAALASQLQGEIARGEVEIETKGRKIVLRIREKGSFSSGSADLKPAYKDIMKNVRDLLVDKPGMIQVQGHTDDIPISTNRFRSNWELSSARAVSVAHELLDEGKLDPNRFTVTGYADTRSLSENDSSEGRERNRRVEIVIQQGVDPETKAKLQVLKKEDPNSYSKLKLDEQFELGVDEVF